MIWIQFNMKQTLASHNLSGYRSNSLIVHCFMHLQYHIEPKWTLADHSLNQFALGDYETFWRFLKQCRTFNLNINLYTCAVHTELQYCTHMLTLCIYFILLQLHHQLGQLVCVLASHHHYAVCPVVEPSVIWWLLLVAVLSVSPHLPPLTASDQLDQVCMQLPCSQENLA